MNIYKNGTWIIFLITILFQQIFAQNMRQIQQKWLNVNYAADTLTGHLLDIYLPDKGQELYPVIVAIAGNAFF